MFTEDVFKGKIITSLIASIVPGSKAGRFKNKTLWFQAQKPLELNLFSVTCFFISKGWMNELYLKRVSCPTCDEIRSKTLFLTCHSLFQNHFILFLL